MNFLTMYTLEFKLDDTVLDAFSLSDTENCVPLVSIKSPSLYVRGP